MAVILIFDQDFVKLPAKSKTGSRLYFTPVTRTTRTTITRARRITSPNFGRRDSPKLVKIGVQSY